MDIVFSCDKAYVMPAAVMLYSLFENNRDSEIRIFALYSGDAECLSPLKDIVERYGGTFTLCDMSNIESPLLPVYQKDQRSHISVAAYYRLFVSEILPAEMDKVLYLDCDIVVEGSIKDLWDIDLEGKPLAAVIDFENNNVCFSNRLEYDTNYGYFNSGVLLINLKYWREHNVLNSFKQYIAEHHTQLFYHDQDVLNHEFHALKKELPIRYNLQSGFLWKEEIRNFNRRYNHQIDEAVNNPCIIHYTEDKPWFKDSTHPMRDYWYKYQNLTEWKGLRRGSNKLKIKQIINKIIYFLGYSVISVLCKENKWKKLYKTEYIKG